MILALPYHPDVPAMWDKITGEIKRRTGNMNHTLLVICRPQDEGAAYNVLRGTGKNFRRSDLRMLQTDNLTPTEVSNQMFQLAMDYLRTYEPVHGEPEQVPLGYYDCTHRPIVDRWLDQLQGEFFKSGMPPVLVSDAEEDPDARKNFKGIILFSPRFPKESALLNYLGPSTHWRAYLAGELHTHAVRTDAFKDILSPRPY